MDNREHFVSDGAGRYFAVLYPEVEAAVVTEFAQRLADASCLERLRLRLLIRREIRRRLNAAVSDQARYSIRGRFPS